MTKTRVITAVTGDSEFASELCRALGFDPGGVVGIDMRLRSGEFVTLTVEQILLDGQAQEALTVIKKYNLEPREQS
jgi:hypothetical protein